jgi:hypothetical protein
MGLARPLLVMLTNTMCLHAALKALAVGRSDRSQSPLLVIATLS